MRAPCFDHSRANLRVHVVGARPYAGKLRFVRIYRKLLKQLPLRANDARHHCAFPHTWAFNARSTRATRATRAIDQSIQISGKLCSRYVCDSRTRAHSSRTNREHLKQAQGARVARILCCCARIHVRASRGQDSRTEQVARARALVWSHIKNICPRVLRLNS